MIIFCRTTVVPTQDIVSLIPNMAPGAARSWMPKNLEASKENDAERGHGELLSLANWVNTHPISW